MCFLGFPQFGHGYIDNKIKSTVFLKLKSFLSIAFAAGYIETKLGESKENTLYINTGLTGCLFRGQSWIYEAVVPYVCQYIRI